ncbi:hypothetical protein [Chryseobacterium indologenes]|uniref:Uncharacterized protein n=1 Tax=Chryseobacterium indologenes TaxID=253 RepID=A0A0N0ZST3_CHRID|nr:hypothetical protein [Chryseobacterium indologenes]KPE49756.1 hypothetical protein AOB46_18700 [Chryseobacterium indologenes]
MITELRKGNYVIGESGRVVRIDGFMQESIYMKVEDERVRHIVHKVKYCNPIQLTNDILMKSGFIQTGHLFSFDLGEGFKIVYNDALKNWHVSIHSTTTASINDIKGFHSLQNIVNSLTGKEIEANFLIQKSYGNKR